jgi:hypothetical protein
LLRLVEDDKPRPGIFRQVLSLLLRISSFNSRANAEEVARRLQELKW